MTQDNNRDLVDGQAVRRDVLLAFQYAHNEDDWVFPLAEALSGVTAADAAWTPDSSDPESRSIWRIVLHMAVWTENVVDRMEQRKRGERPGRPAEGAWPPLPSTLDEAAWQADQERLENALMALRAHIAGTHAAALLDPGAAGYSQLADVMCRLVHNAYHIGQITKLREWMDAKTEA